MELDGAEVAHLLGRADHRDAAGLAQDCESIAFTRADARAFADIYRTRAQLQEVLRRFEVATQIRRVLMSLDSYDVAHVLLGLVSDSDTSYVVVLTEAHEVVGVVETPRRPSEPAPSLEVL